MSAYWSGDRRRLMASALPALGEKFVLAMRAGDQLRPDPPQGRGHPAQARAYHKRIGRNRICGFAGMRVRRLIPRNPAAHKAPCPGARHSIPTADVAESACNQIRGPIEGLAGHPRAQVFQQNVTNLLSSLLRETPSLWRGRYR